MQKMVSKSEAKEIERRESRLIKAWRDATTSGRNTLAAATGR